MMQTATSESKDLDFIIALVYERSRIRLHEGKQQLIRARLGKRVRHHGFADLHQYCQYLRHDAGEEEICQVVDALATNFTHFLREPDHFEFLRHEALPGLVGEKPRPFRVWSAACATGEEPYSIAFHLMEAYPPAAGWDWRILATDISRKALRQAESGIYRHDRMSGLPREWLGKFFQRGYGQWEGYYRVRRPVAERVAFQQLNLLSDYDVREHFEVIFCRNVMIYFDRATQAALVNRLSESLAPGGYLVVGHSESLIGLSLPVRCQRPSIYQRV